MRSLGEYFDWDEKDRKFALVNRLSGAALRFIKIHKTKSVKELESILRERFVRKETPDVALSKFTNFKQPSSMSVQEFYDKMSDMSMHTLVVDGVDPAVAEDSRKALLHCILLSNLAPEIRKGVITKDPKTPEQILEFALLEEKALRSINPFTTINNDFNTFNTSQQTPHMACAATFFSKSEEKHKREMEELREKLNLLTAKIDSWVEKKEPEQSTRIASNSNTFVCNYCRQPNHYARDCVLKNQQFSAQNRNNSGNYQNSHRLQLCIRIFRT